jgi:hypothetical protein
VIGEWYQSCRQEAPKADNDFEQAIPSPGSRTAADRAIEHPRSQSHSTHKGADHRQHGRHFMAQPSREHLRPDDLVAKPGASGAKEEQIEQSSLAARAHHEKESNCSRKKQSK